MSMQASFLKKIDKGITKVAQVVMAPIYLTIPELNKTLDMQLKIGDEIRRTKAVLHRTLSENTEQPSRDIENIVAAQLGCIHEAEQQYRTIDEETSSQITTAVPIMLGTPTSLFYILNSDFTSDVALSAYAGLLCASAINYAKVNKQKMRHQASIQHRQDILNQNRSPQVYEPYDFFAHDAAKDAIKQAQKLHKICCRNFKTCSPFHCNFQDSIARDEDIYDIITKALEQLDQQNKEVEKIIAKMHNQIK